jgi:hypothetical protein
MEQWRVAMICFKMWGELSPTKELPATSPSTTMESDNDAAKKKNDDLEQKQEEKTEQPIPPPTSATMKRSIGQAEVESAYFKVNVFFVNWVKVLINSCSLRDHNKL